MADTPHERWTDGPVLEEVEADQTIEYFFIAGPDGQVQGAMWLGTSNHYLGYLEKVAGTAGYWGGVCVTALRNSRWDGRKAFEFWSDPANESVEAFSVGPVKEAHNIGELQVLLRDA